jgi:hypothetical protein
MRTTFPLAVILALGIASAFFVGSGFNALVEGERDLGQVQNEVNKSAGGSPVAQEELESNRRGTEDGSIVDLVLSSAGDIAKFVGLVAILPVTLQELGFPTWFAAPVGSLVTIIVSIGLIQFVSGRVLR